MEISTPVLLIGFNRLKEIQQTFNYIRAARPKKLYVSIDGPRINNPNDVINVESVINIVSDVDWDCDVNYLFHEFNLGCALNVTGAISWAFEKEESLIIIEDDIVAPLSFFEFAQAMLLKYKENKNVSIVSGFNPLGYVSLKEDYFFTMYGTSWGWGTWKRVWDMYNFNIDLNFDLIDKSIFQSKRELEYHKNLFNNLRAKGLGNAMWDYILYYILLKNKCLSIMPIKNLIENNGTFGTHAKGQEATHFTMVDICYTADKHPVDIELNRNANQILFHKGRVPKKSLYSRLLSKLKRIVYKES